MPLRPYHVHVDDFPRMPGEVDDAPRINRAIATAVGLDPSGRVGPRTPCVVEFSDARYDLASPVDIRYDDAHGEVRGVRLVGQTNGVGLGSYRTRLMWVGPPPPTGTDSTMMRIYSHDNVIEGVFFEADRFVGSAVRITEGTSKSVMTENVFRHCYFGTSGDTGRRALMRDGVVIGDNLDWTPPPPITGRPPLTYPVQCDYVRFYDCQFAHVEQACVRIPNVTGNSVEHLFDCCRFQTAKYGLLAHGSNATFRNCAFANLESMMQVQGNWQYNTLVQGGQAEKCRAMFTGGGNGEPSSVTMTSFRFSPDAPTGPGPDFVIDMAGGAALVLIGVQFSGAPRDNVVIRVTNNNDSAPFPVVALGCTFANDRPFQHMRPGPSGPVDLTMLGCQTIGDYEGLTKVARPLDDALSHVPNTKGEFSRHRVAGVYDVAGKRLLMPKRAAKIEPVPSADPALLAAKVNQIIAMLEAHGLHGD